MMFKKKEKVRDERIEKEESKLVAPVFYLFSAGLLISLVVKLVMGETYQNFLLELCCLLPSWGYALVKGGTLGVLWMKEKDEALCSIRNDIMKKAYMIAFWILTTGQLIYMYFVADYMKTMGLPENITWTKEWTWSVVYLLIDLVPAAIISVYSLKKGLLVWGSKKREVTGKKEFAKRTVMGALLFGVLMGLPELFVDGVFQPRTILVMLGMGAAWGIPFYFLMMAFIKISEKNADKAVKEEEDGSKE